ncbi:MAG: cell division protein FtsW [Bacillati bacterium ANGP1]|uniref:Probable peptidoglycan glycosyltransferase FtsW n=1 Tax=Candidatus Segetimicrobium genomatis TaxID=2569760 RepID=A0A537M9J0_9BACT|nr:MAG: cell division protein FtsW [Terrabacteria group bacterium ANGP1]
MDVIHRRAAAWGVFVTALSLTCIGIVMVYSASSVAAQAQYHDGAFFLKRQVAFAFIGLGVMSVAWKVHYARLRRWALPLMCLAVLAVTIVLFPHVGRVAGGARRWVSIGGAFNFQPAEMAKLALILYLSNFLANRGARVREFGPGLVPPLIVFRVMLFVGGARIEHLLGIGCLAVPAVLAVILREGYRSSRLLAFLDPWKDPQGTGFHIIQSWLALGSGGVAGLGLGQSTQKFFYLPARHTDFIFAIIGEELGLVGAYAVLLLFVFLAVWGYRVASRLPDRYGVLLTTGLTTLLVGQAALNVGVVTGAVPVTGVPLPFVSFGGSSLVSSFLAIGVLLNLSQYAHPADGHAAAAPSRPPRHRGVPARP